MLGMCESFSNAYLSSSTSCLRTFSIPIEERYSTATPSPIASAMFVVPASNLYGTSFHLAPSRWTSLIMSPPDWKGSMEFRSSFLP